MAWPVASKGTLVGDGACGSCFSVGQAESGKCWASEQSSGHTCVCKSACKCEHVLCIWEHTPAEPKLEQKD